MTCTFMPITARRATLDEIFQVRWDVLRPDRPREVACFPGDDAPESIHAGAFDATGRNVACATLTRVDWRPIDALGEHTPPQPAWQLRGMGVIAGLQGQGVGQLLLSTVEQLARDSADTGRHGIRLLWCNGRKEAARFYEKQGWRIASAEFHIEDVGPHYKMTRVLGQ
jgi:GNAT superfamily N-acetyltransferase